VYYVYVLRSEKSAAFYSGQTKHLEKRLLEHNLGKNTYTRKRGPWALVYFEACPTRSLAIKRERFFKTGKGREYIKERIGVGA
jgi:putative endonuclease